MGQHQRPWSKETFSVLLKTVPLWGLNKADLKTCKTLNLHCSQQLDLCMNYCMLYQIISYSSVCVGIIIIPMSVKAEIISGNVN